MPPSHEELKRWAQERHERNERIREGMFFDLRGQRSREDSPAEPQRVEHIVRHSNMGQEEFSLLLRLKDHVDQLQRQLNRRAERAASSRDREDITDRVR